MANEALTRSACKYKVKSDISAFAEDASIRHGGFLSKVNKDKAAGLFLGTVIGLILFKGVVAWLTDSLSVLAQALDSLLDLLAGFIIFVAVRAADRKEDVEHPYGHGKLEDFAGLSQGILIGIAGIGIIYASIRRIVSPVEVQMAEAGIAVMVVSIVVSILLSSHLKKVALRTGSTALEAGAKNVQTDVYSALAVLMGLLLLRITGLTVIDPILAIAVALYILKVGCDTFRKPFSRLIDTRLSPEKEEVIRKSIMNHEHEVAGYHQLRTRQAGDKCHIDLHIIMRKDIPLATCHRICDEIEAEIKRGLPHSSIVIHAEPCMDTCGECSIICTERKP
jgi:cation diffusion facilitator family transporter